MPTTTQNAELVAPTSMYKCSAWLRMTHRHMAAKKLFTARVVNCKAGDEQGFTLLPIASLPLEHLQLAAEKHMTSSNYQLHSLCICNGTAWRLHSQLCIWLHLQQTKLLPWHTMQVHAGIACIASMRVSHTDCIRSCTMDVVSNILLVHANPVKAMQVLLPRTCKTGVFEYTVWCPNF